MKRTRAPGIDHPKINDDRDRLWAWVIHEEDVFSDRMSFFLLAQSILIAVSAAVSNTLAGLHSAHHLVRLEVFGLAVSLDLAGLALTLIFWFIFNMNSSGLAILTERLRSLDEMYADLSMKWQEERLRHWYSRLLHPHGSNRTVKNFLPPVILLFWCAITIFSVAIFFAG